MKYDIDHRGYCATCGRSIDHETPFVRPLEDGRPVLYCRACFLKSHPDSAAHGPRFTHPEDAR